MKLRKIVLSYVLGTLFAAGLAPGAAFADDQGRGHDRGRATLLVTSTNNATANDVVVFRLDAGTTPSLTYVTSLPTGPNRTPLGAAFWGDILGFDPAHSPNSLALVDGNRTVYPIAGPTPAFPNGNAPCWLAKGPGNLWYSANSPAHAISTFFSD